MKSMTLAVADRFDEPVAVCRVIATSRQSDWAVLQVADRNGELFTAVGTALKRFAEPGRTIRVAGRWRDHPDYGRQLSVSSVAPQLLAAGAAADTTATLLRVPHVGAKRAQLLIDRFGAERVVAEIDAGPRRAFAAVGLGFHEAADAARWWRDQRKA